MKLPSPLIEARLVKRYKRFLADVELKNGECITVHCPNPGSMMGLKQPGSKVWISDSKNPKRKLRYSLELMEADGVLVSINTMRPNALAEEALMQSMVPTLTQFAELKREVPYGENSRVDILLTNHNGTLTYVEVKNCHLVRQTGLYEFPDSVTARGAKHLRELSAMVQAGHRAVLLFIAQRPDGDRLTLANDLDPAYGQAHVDATKAGVETLCMRCAVSLTDVTPTDPVPFVFRTDI